MIKIEELNRSIRTCPGKKKMGRPKGSKKSKTIERIIGRSLTLFSDQGYSETSFSQVAKDSGMTHAALYRYFKNKQELYLATLDYAESKLQPYFVMATISGNSFVERLTITLVNLIEDYDKTYQYIGFLVNTPIEVKRDNSLEKAVKKKRSQIIDALRKMIKIAIKSGEIDTTIKERDIITTIIGGSIGVVLFNKNSDEKDLKSSISIFIEVISNKVFK